MNVLPDSNSELNSWLLDANATPCKVLNHPLMQKDTWKLIDDLNLKVSPHYKVVSVSFKFIRQDWFKLLVKMYILVRSGRKLSASSVKGDLWSFNRFSEFLHRESIYSTEQINNQLFDEFDRYLQSLNLSQNSIAYHYKTLINFFELCGEEGWLKVHTYWFKGRRKKSIPKNDDIEYIPEEVWQQLDEHLHYLPEPLQRMILVIRSTGLRVGELLNLPLDCLHSRDRQWRLRFITEKYQTVDEIPICDDLAVLIKEQQEYIKNCFADNYKNLFNGYKHGGHNSYMKKDEIPAPKVMSSIIFNKRLNELAQKYNICTNTNQLWHFKSHQFRKTFATVMTNSGVRDLIIQKYLRHRSSDMQSYYKHLFKEVLGEEYQELMETINYVNITGELVAAHTRKNLITEVIRRKIYQVTTQHGECHRPVLKSPCQTVNACWRCEYWLTSTDDLSALRQDFQRIEIELDVALKSGMYRQEQGLRVDRQNLVIRIQKLEKINNGE